LDILTLQRTKIAAAVGAAALVAGGIWLWAPWHTLKERSALSSELVPGGPPPPAIRPAPAKAQPERKVIARVGDIELTNLDLARYQRLRGISLGMIADRRALGELCDRALLNLAAAEHHIALTQPELEHELLRRKAIIGATSSGLRAPETGAPASLIDQGEQVLAASGLPLVDFQSEVQAEAIADRAKQVLVYDQIQISNWELGTVNAAEQKSTARMPWDRHSRRLAARRGLDHVSAERLRERMRHERGAEPLRALLKELTERWKVELVEG
jgi:hypothetical protein